MTALFFSYAHGDQKLVLTLAEEFQLLGISIWIAKQNLTGGSLWVPEIVKAITNCDFFILFVSLKSIKSDSVLREVDLAYKQKRHIIPLLLEKVNLPPSLEYQLAGIQWIESWEPNWKLRLLLAIGNSSAQIVMAEEKGIETRDKMQLRVFLCHSSGDKPAVRSLFHKLSGEVWIDPWLDEEKLDPGDYWKIEIGKAVKASDIVIVCLSCGSINKAGFVQKEIRYALDKAQEIPAGKIFIIPLKLEECSVPDELSEWQWVNYYEDGAYEKLMRALHKRARELDIETK